MTTVSAEIRRLIAIEPDRERARLLKDLLKTFSHASVQIVTSADDAIKLMEKARPDLLMVSTFLPPAQEATLTAYVRRTSGSSLQIIDLPYFLDGDEAAQARASNRKVLQFLRGRSVSIRPRCGAQTLREQVEQYLQQAVCERPALKDRLEAALPSAAGLLPGGLEAPPTSGAGSQFDRGAGTGSILGHRADRRRARRRRPTELPYSWKLKLPWASEARIIDISSTGVLLETTTKIVAGTMLDVQLQSEAGMTTVPARALRTDVASVDSLGVRYRVAAAFSRTLEMDGLDSGAPPLLELSALGDVLKRALGEGGLQRGVAEATAAFEAELRRLLRVRDVEIREKPLAPPPDCDSVWFAVPTGAPSSPVLQVTFDPGRATTEQERRFVRGAARVASVLLSVASETDESRKTA